MSAHDVSALVAYSASGIFPSTAHRAIEELASNARLTGKDGAGEGHKLGQQQRQNHAGVADAHLAAVGGCHRDDGVHAVDVAEVGKDEVKDGRIAPNLFERLSHAGEGVADLIAATLQIMGLTDIAQQRNGQ